MLFLLSLIFSTSLMASSPRSKVVYGEDNRIDTYESDSSLFKKLAKSSAAMVQKRLLVNKGGVIELHTSALKETIPPGMRDFVCETERFSHQPVLSDCSGVLVGDDIMATAGHCVMSDLACEAFVWVFNYRVEDKDQSFVNVAPEDVFHCVKVLHRGLTRELDYALIKLDRPVKGGKVKMTITDPVPGDGVVVIGHPSGLPQKIAQGVVSSQLALGFNTNLDAFRGNSGSGVFNPKTGELLGLLINGKQDYLENDAHKCSAVNVLLEDEGSEGVSSIKQFNHLLEFL